MLLCKKCIRISTNADVMMMAKDELVGLVSCEIVWRMFRASLPIYLIQEVDPDYHPISFILSISAKLNFKKKMCRVIAIKKFVVCIIYNNGIL